MPIRLFSYLIFIFLYGNVANATIHHQLNVTIEPSKSYISVSDTLRFSDEMTVSDNSIEFLLHRDLVIDSNGNIEKLPKQNIPDHLNLYRITEIPENKQVTLRYAGSINHDLQQSNKENARSFSSTLGIIDKRGVFLDGSAAWYAYIPNTLVSFDLEIH
ncbi:MAG: hypothetical protein COB94_002935, partial [Gammaproteobacteria bacterium]|nr:hypothetical protein [Gammaproteobacteria bacterium]